MYSSRIFASTAADAYQDSWYSVPTTDNSDPTDSDGKKLLLLRLTLAMFGPN